MALLALLDPLVLLAPQEMLVPLVPLVLIQLFRGRLELLAPPELLALPETLERLELIQLFPGQLALLDHKGISVLLDLLALLELIL